MSTSSIRMHPPVQQAEFKLGIRDDDPFLPRVIAPRLIKPDAQGAHLLRDRVPQEAAGIRPR